MNARSPDRARFRLTGARDTQAPSALVSEASEQEAAARAHPKSRRPAAHAGVGRQLRQSRRVPPGGTSALIAKGRRRRRGLISRLVPIWVRSLDNASSGRRWRRRFRRSHHRRLRAKVWPQRGGAALERPAGSRARPLATSDSRSRCPPSAPRLARNRGTMSAQSHASSAIPRAQPGSPDPALRSLAPL